MCKDQFQIRIMANGVLASLGKCLNAQAHQGDAHVKSPFSKPLCSPRVPMSALASLGKCLNAQGSLRRCLYQVSFLEALRGA